LHNPPEIEVLPPVHNDGEGIATTTRAIYDELSLRVRVQFIVREDGSRDTTKEVLS